MFDENHQSDCERGQLSEENCNLFNTTNIFTINMLHLTKQIFHADVQIRMFL